MLRILGIALVCVAVSVATAAGGAEPGPPPMEGARTITIDKVALANRTDKAITVFLLPDVGTYTLAAGGVQKFACAFVKGFALSAGGRQHKAICGKAYAIRRGAHGLEIVESSPAGDRP